MGSEDLCKNCRTIIVCLVRDNFSECPCLICLIKVMCSKSCVPYSKFFNSAIADKFQITEEKKYVHKR
jgi:hypothetical protein